MDEVRLLSPSLAYPPAELWDRLAVSIAKPLPEFFGLRLASNQVLFPRVVRELYYTVYCVDRIDGYSEAIHVEAELPNGVTTSGNDKPVGNSKNNEYRFELRGPAELPLGKHRISISAIGSFQGQTKEVKISEIPFHVIDPLIVSLEISNSDSKPGEVAIRVKATRFVPRAGGDRKEIICKWKDRPAWLSGPESFIVATGKNEEVVRMSVTESKDQSDRVGQLVLIAETVVSDQTVQVESEPFELRYPAPDETK